MGTPLRLREVTFDTGRGGEPVEIVQISDIHFNKILPKDLQGEFDDIIKGVFNGHTHSNYYTEIQAKTADGIATFIPQYTLHGNFYENGNVLKITVQ